MHRAQALAPVVQRVAPVMQVQRQVGAHAPRAPPPVQEPLGVLKITAVLIMLIVCAHGWTPETLSEAVFAHRPRRPISTSMSAAGAVSQA